MKIRALLLAASLFVVPFAVCAQGSPVAAMPAQQVPPAPADLTAAAKSNIEGRVEAFLRNLYAWGPTFGLKIGPIKSTPLDNLYEVTVDVSQQGQTESAIVWVSKDGRFIFRGDLDDMTVDPLASVRSDLHLDGAASTGPDDAKVVVVEFGDFECPVCRQFDQMLHAVMPKYPQVRFVFKDFPLQQIHPWSMTGALAGRCALQKSQDVFWKLHDAIYREQDSHLTPDNAFARLEELAKQAGLDTDTYEACMADQKTKEVVQKSIDEGHDLDVNATPTIFVNGRRLRRSRREQALLQYIEYDLHAADGAPSRRQNPRKIQSAPGV